MLIIKINIWIFEYKYKYYLYFLTTIHNKLEIIIYIIKNQTTVKQIMIIKETFDEIYWYKNKKY